MEMNIEISPGFRRIAPTEDSAIFVDEMKLSMMINGEKHELFVRLGIDVWTDTTVLFITVFSGESEDSPVIGKGMLKIKIDDFTKQLTTLKAINTKDQLESLSAKSKFGKLFAGNVIETYFK